MSRTIKAVEPHMIPQAKVPPVRLAALIDSGNVKVVLDRILPLSEARRAHELSQNGHARGKIVLRVKED
jgi:NADPH:quinone reductase-like Zn-dependent oxidoreductase